MTAEVVVNVVPAGFHNDVDGGSLPVGVHDMATGKVVEVLAVMHIRPYTHGAVGEGALPSFDVFRRKHIYIILQNVTNKCNQLPFK